MQPPPRPTAEDTLPVWDAGVRVFHWGLAAAIAAAAWTGFVLGRTALTWHLIAGGAAAGAVGWRIVWGMCGPTYARFAGFVPSFGRLRAYLRAGGHMRHVGHNPLGALMVVVLLSVVAAIGLSGAVTLGGLLKQGPLRAFLSYAAGRQWRGIHNALAIGLLGLIGAHLAGVAVESWRGRENLLAAMLTGRKRRAPPFVPVAPARARPRFAMSVTLAGLLAATLGIAALAALPGRGVPPALQDAMFAEQCGACHLAFPPSLAPAATWRGILADLQHHFGADATLSAEQVAHLRAWLDANSAEHWDDLPSHLLRRAAADGALRITDTPGWRRMHRHIPASAFADTRRSDCAACHADAATGRFAPQRISLPE